MKIMIVDDHQLVREGLAELLKNQKNLEVVGLANDGEQAIELALKHHPDVVLMDIQMPKMDGLEATKTLLKINPDIKVLALTVCESDVVSIQFIDEGGMGYLTKGASIKEIMEAIESAYRGERYISPSITRKIAQRKIDNLHHSESLSDLSSRELQVFKLIVQGKKLGEIAEDLNVNYKTITTYRTRIYEKLGAKNVAELILLAIRHGLLDVNKT